MYGQVRALAIGQRTNFGHLFILNFTTYIGDQQPTNGTSLKRWDQALLIYGLHWMSLAQNLHQHQLESKYGAVALGKMIP